MLDAYHCLFVWRFEWGSSRHMQKSLVLQPSARQIADLRHRIEKKTKKQNKLKVWSVWSATRLPSAIISHRLPVVVPRTMGIPDVVLTILRLVPRAFLWSTLELLFECHWGVLNYQIYQYVFVIGNWSLESDFASCWICVSWNRGPSLLEHAGIIGYPQFYQLFNLSRSIV